MKCKQCNRGNHLLEGKEVHLRCKTVWDAEHILEGQKKEISICPHCKEEFKYWQLASLHAKLNEHWGDYTT